MRGREGGDVASKGPMFNVRQCAVCVPGRTGWVCGSGTWVTQDKKSPDRGTDSRTCESTSFDEGLADLLGSGRAANTNECLGLIFMNLGGGPGHAGPSAMQDVFYVVQPYLKHSWTISFLLMSTLEGCYAHR